MYEAIQLISVELRQRVCKQTFNWRDSVSQPVMVNCSLKPCQYATELGLRTIISLPKIWIVESRGWSWKALEAVECVHQLAKSLSYTAQEKGHTSLSNSALKNITCESWSSFPQ